MDWVTGQLGDHGYLVRAMQCRSFGREGVFQEKAVRFRRLLIRPMYLAFSVLARAKGPFHGGALSPPCFRPYVPHIGGGLPRMA